MAKAREFKISGFVTEIVSKDIFEVDDYRIRKNAKTKIDVVMEGNVLEDHPTPHAIRIETELEVKGDLVDGQKELPVSSIMLFLKDEKKVKGTALIEKMLFVPFQSASELAETGAQGQNAPS